MGLVCKPFVFSLPVLLTNASQEYVRSIATSQKSCTDILLQRFLNQLPHILQQPQNPRLTSSGVTHTEVKAIEDGCLSAASLPVGPTSEQIHTPTQTEAVDDPNRTTVQPSRPCSTIQNQGHQNYIEFTTILPKSIQEPTPKRSNFS